MEFRKQQANIFCQGNEAQKPVYWFYSGIMLNRFKLNVPYFQLEVECFHEIIVAKLQIRQFRKPLGVEYIYGHL